MKRIVIFAILLLIARTAGAEQITVLAPPLGEKAYQLAAEAFADLWQKVTGQRAVLRMADAGQRGLPLESAVLIGSDAVQPAVHELIRSGAIEGLGLEYGNDNYRMLSLERNGKTYLILAGGSGHQP